jgi:hypothetical protein
MSDTSDTPATSELLPQVPAIRVDTTSGSILHRFIGLLDRLGINSAFIPLALYITAVTLTSVPLLIGAAFSPWPMTVSGGGLRIPFLFDAAAQFMVLVSFPCILILTSTDQRVLTRSLNIVQADGTITIEKGDQEPLAKRWQRLFLITNIAAQSLGLLIGGVIAYFNFKIFSPALMGHWMAHDERLLPVGYVYLYCIVLFYGMVTVYVIRNMVIALLLHDIVAHAHLHMLPMHPDKAGGLQPVGRLGLRNQYALTACGLNIVAAMAVIHIFLNGQYNHLQIGLLIGALVVAYLILGPAIFMGPLLPFRQGMLRNKAELMSKVALRLRIKLDDLYARMASGEITAEDEESIQRLRRLDAVIDELPVWPFDAPTLRKFLTAYVLPIASSFGLSVVKVLVDYFKIGVP